MENRAAKFLLRIIRISDLLLFLIAFSLVLYAGWTFSKWDTLDYFPPILKMLLFISSLSFVFYFAAFFVSFIMRTANAIFHFLLSGGALLYLILFLYKEYSPFFPVFSFSLDRTVIILNGIIFVCSLVFLLIPSLRDSLTDEE